MNQPKEKPIGVEVLIGANVNDDERVKDVIHSSEVVDSVLVVLLHDLKEELALDLLIPSREAVHTFNELGGERGVNLYR